MGGSADWQSMTRQDRAVTLNPFSSASVSERSASVDEVENILGASRQANRQFMRPANSVTQYSSRILAQPAGEFARPTLFLLKIQAQT